MFRSDSLNFQIPQFTSMKRESGKLTVSDLASRMGRSKIVGDQNLSKEERATLIQNFHPNLNDEVDFEFYLRVSIVTP